MEEYVYEEEKYIKRKDLKEYEDLMLKHEYNPEEIQDDVEFSIVMRYLISLTGRAPDFLQPYEFAISMISCLHQHKAHKEIIRDLECKWVAACIKIAKKEDIFNKQVPWVWLENRPLVRGLFFEANSLWEAGKIADAHDLFCKILRTNEADNIGARYSVKATAEGMTIEEFEERFTYSDANGTYYKNQELEKWFG